jgi:hypothetical protein
MFQGHRNAILSSDVPEMITHQNMWNSLEIDIYHLHLIRNVGMLTVKIDVL